MFSLPEDSSIAALARHGRASRRLRFEISTLIGNPELAQEIEAAAGSRPDITRIAADPFSNEHCRKSLCLFQ